MELFILTITINIFIVYRYIYLDGNQEATEADI